MSEQKTEKSEEDIKLDMIAALSGKIDLSEKEMDTQYDHFMRSYPEGKINSNEFKTSFGNKWACSSEFLFKVFDEDKNEFLDFTEFTIASNCIGSFLPGENLCWIDNVRGSVDADDAHKVVVSILKIIGFDEDITSLGN
jgi:Ca2+-binding EF-hand superfamily protein